MGLQAVIPGRHTSMRYKAHKVYPYLLRYLEATRPNQVLGHGHHLNADEKGFMNMATIIDLYSRHIVGWSIFNNMDAEWCKEVLEETISQYGRPEILNTDQGSQFTAEVYSLVEQVS